MSLSKVNAIIHQSQDKLAAILRTKVSESGIAQSQYIRFLSMQYHLTKHAYWYFTVAASHASISRKKILRNFLIQFAREEELHYLVAGKDILSIGGEILSEPIDVTLWHAFFQKVVLERPFERLGAACVLENISGGQVKPQVKRLLSTPFLNRDNTRFIIIHQHEKIPHGEQILKIFKEIDMNAQELEDLNKGAEIGACLYLRMIDWSMSFEECEKKESITANEKNEVESFSITQIEHDY
ncbi:Iron-containing redox enzyme family protein [Azospirillaceae bacterium]